MVKFQPGVPYWEHHYVYSASEIQRASKDQRVFYFYFRDSFVNGTFYDLEGNTNYAFILLFDLVDGYGLHKNLSRVEAQLSKLGELYPKTKPYIRSSLFRKAAEIGDSEGMDRLRDQQEQDSYYARSGYYEYGYWQFGGRHKKRLNLTDDEVKVLNRLSYPSNNFLDIQFCCDQVIKVFLWTVKQLSAEYESEETLDGCFAAIADVVASEHFGYQRNSSNYKYCVQYMSYQIYTVIFKQCENAVREHFGHKRKLKIELFYDNELRAEIYEKLTTRVAVAISAGLTLVEAPDEACEIELNAQNTGRWKIAFQKLTTENGLNSEQFGEKIKLLADLNKRNPSIENIFFEASKFVSRIDKKAALDMYIYYLHHDLKSVRFDNKKLTKTIQKSLFSTNEQLRDFEKIISDLITDRDLEKALAAVIDFYTPKRKHISLSRKAILEARSKHSDTVELLNEYLRDEFEDGENAIVAEEITGGEVRIEITSKIDAVPGATSTSVVDLSQEQAELLQLFAKGSFNVSHGEVEEFARGKGLFRNQLIESINEICYEILDDVLIEEEDEHYVVSENYYRTIIRTC
ncbi:MAG TPA: tellurite resistance TerB C-terminal domain-containing protein [Pyrinomonadaceae bacterium]|nr:tellurite resistance TerB C-terminal domain-containing protein [Pyrinomonadaceae bacterium]